MKVFSGDIITCDQQGSVFRHLVEDEGRIIYVGNDLPEHYEDCPDQIDLGSKALLPVFGDGHIHYSMWALFNASFDVRSASSLAEVIEIVANYAERTPGAGVLFGYGHSSHVLKEKRLISRTELDQAVKNKPVYLVCYDGHSAVANTATMGLLPLEIRKLHGFNLESGYLSNEAFFAATDNISGKMSPLKLFSYLLQGLDTLADFGVGMIHTVESVGFPRDMDVDLVRFIAKSAPIEFRIFFQTMVLEKVIKRKLPRVGGCFACALDGCFGVKDAAMIEPYNDDPYNRGTLFYRDDVVDEFVINANRAGLQVQLHCIGDAAVTQAVNAIEKALIDYPRDDHRHTLIHASLIPEPVYETIANLDIGITLQPAIIISPLEPLDYLEEILGDRVKLISPLKQLHKMGIKVSGGSDAPVVAPNPIEGIYGACNHFNPEQSLSIEEALRLFTCNVAYTTFDEGERGSLEKGKTADMVVLNQNPLLMDSQDLLELKVETTYLQGLVYEPDHSWFNVLKRALQNRSRKI